MGHQAVQRVVVRMLYDEAFVAKAHERPAEVLGDAGLDAAEQAALLAVDRRAWRTDPLRRRKTLRTLVEEYKITTTLAFAETRSLAFVEGYFASPEFHSAVQERRSIALAFGEFFANALTAGHLKTPQLEAVARLETTMARCRRGVNAPAASAAAAPTQRVILAPGTAVDAFECNLIETLHRVEQYLFEVGLMPQVALCDDAPRLGDLPEVSSERLCLLLRASGRDVKMTYLEESMFHLLSETRTARTPSQLAARLGAGARLDAVKAAVDALLEEGVLVGAP